MLLLEDILEILPEDATFAHTVRKVDDRYYMGFEKKIRVNVFAAEDVMVVTSSKHAYTDTLESGGYKTVTYTVTEHAADEDDRILYSGDIDGKITFRVPNSLFEAEVDYILLQEPDVVMVRSDDELTEYDEYVYASMQKAFEGIVVYGTIPLQHWVAVGNSLYYIPTGESSGEYWFEFGFNKPHPTVLFPTYTDYAEEYRINLLHNRISNITPSYQMTTMFYGKAKNGEYRAMLPDLTGTTCSVLCVVPEVLYTEESKKQAEKEIVLQSAEELAAEVLKYTDGEYDDVEDKIIAALQFAVATLEQVYGETGQQVAKAEEKQDDVEDIFADFDLGDF